MSSDVDANDSSQHSSSDSPSNIRVINAIKNLHCKMHHDRASTFSSCLKQHSNLCTNIVSNALESRQEDVFQAVEAMIRLH